MKKPTRAPSGGFGAFTITTSTAAIRTAFCVVIAGAAISAALAGAAFAQARDYAIGPGRLSDVLAQYAAVSGVQLVYDPAALAALNSAGLSGSYTVQQGFSQLLAGSGYELRAAGARNYVLIRSGGSGDAAGLTDDGSVMLGTIVISGGFSGEATYDVPGATFTVDGEMLDRVRPTSTGDILKGVPGVLAGNSHVSPSIDPNIRGAQGMGRVSVTVDGMENSSSTYRGYGGSSTQFYLDPDFLGGFEVDKSTAMTGGNAIGGRIAMRTVSADELISEGKTWGGQLKLSIGTANGDGSRFDNCTGRGQPGYCIGTDTRVAFDPALREGIPGHDYAASLLLGWRPNDRVEFTFGYARRESGNYDTGKHGSLMLESHTAAGVQTSYYDNISIVQRDSEAWGTYRETESYMASARINLTPDQTLTLRFSNYDAWYGSYTTGDVSVTAPAAYYLRPSTTEQSTYGLTWNWAPESQPLIDLSADLWRGGLEEFRAGRSGQVVVTDTTGIRVQNVSRFDLFGRESSLTFGGQILREKVTATGGDSSATRDVIDATRDTKAIYASLEVQATPWLKLTAAGRHDRYETDSKPGTTAASLTKGSGNSYRLGLTADLPWDGTQAFASLSDGWRAPTIREETLRVHASNPGGLPIRPETMRSWEIGFNYSGRGIWREGDFLGAKLGYFDNEYTDYISGNGYLPAFANMPSLTYRGIELALNYDTDRFYAEYSMTHYTKAELCGMPLLPSYSDRVGCSPGTSGVIGPYGVASAPEFTHVLTFGARFMEERLNLGTRITHVTDSAFSKTYRLDGADVSSVNRIHHPYTTVDLFGSYDITDATKVDFSVENVTDRFYLDAGSATYGMTIPAPGRTVRVGLTHKF